MEASAQELYTNLINDEFFINLNNGFADLLSGVNGFVEALGGLKTLLPLIIGLLLKTFGPTMISMMSSFTANFKMTGAVQTEQALQLRKDALKGNAILGSVAKGQVGSVSVQNSKEDAQVIKNIEGIERQISKQQEQQLQQLVEQLRIRREIAQIMAEQVDKNQEAIETTQVEQQQAKENAISSVDPMKQRDFKQALNNSKKKIVAATEDQMAIDDIKSDIYMTDKGDFDSEKAKAVMGNLANNNQFTKMSKEQQKAVTNFANNGGSETDFKTVLKQIDDFNAAEITSQQEVARLSKKYNASEKDLQKYAQSTIKLTKDTKKQDQALNSLTEQMHENTKATKDAIKQINKMKKASLGETFIGMASSLGMVTAGLSSIYSGISSVVDMFATGEHSIEGWLGALSGIGMMLPMLIAGINSFKGAIQGAGIAQSIMNMQDTIAEKLLLRKISKMRVVDALAKMRKGEITKEQLQQAYGITLDGIENMNAQEQLRLLKAQIAAQKAKVATDKEETVSIITKIGAKIKETITTIKDTAATILNWIVKNWLIAAIMAVVAALIALVAWLISSESAEEKAAAAAKEAGGAAQALGEQYQKLTEKANAFRDAVSGYEDAIKSLEDLTKGTKEYEEAVEEANKKARELIETYDLYGQYEMKDGVIQFAPGALEKAQLKLDNQAAEAGIQANAAKIRANEAQKEYRNEILASDSGYSKNQVDSIISSLSDYNAVETGKDMSDYAKDLFPEDQFKNLYDEAGNLKSSFEDAVKATDKASKANEAYAKEMLKQQIQLKYGEELQKAATNSQGEINEAKLNQLEEFSAEIASKNQSELDEVQADIFKKTQDIKNTTQLETYLTSAEIKGGEAGGVYDIHNDEELAKTYAVLADYASSRDEVDYKAGNGEGTFIVDGEEKTLTDDYMRREVARMLEVQKYMEDNGINQSGVSKEFMKTLTQISQNAEKAGQQYGTDFSMALLNSKDGQLSLGSTLDAISIKERDQLLNASDDDIYKLFGIDPNQAEEQLQALGYNSAEDFLAQVRNGLAKEYDLTKYKENIDKTSESIAESTELDADEFKAFTNILYETTNAVEGLSETLLGNGEAAQQVAQDILQYNKALGAISENIVTWKELRDTMSGNAKIAAETRAIYKDLLDMETADFSEAFLVNNIDLLEQVANGVEGAYEKLRKLAQEDIVAQLYITKENKSELRSQMTELENYVGTLEIGASIDQSKINEDFLDIINKAKLTKEQTEAILSSMEINAVVNGDEGNISISQATRASDGELKNKLGEKEDKETPNERRKRLKDLEQEKEYYHEIEEILEDIERELDRISKKKDRAFGVSKLNYMKQESEQLQNELKAEEKLLEIAKKRLQANYNLAASYGAVLDENNQISNYEELINAQIDKMKKMEGTGEAYEREEEKLEEMRNAFDLYEDTLEKVKDTEDSITDAQYRLQDLALEKITYKVDFKVQMSEEDLKTIEFLQQTIEDNAFVAVKKIGYQAKIADETISQIKAKQEGMAKIMDEVKKQGFITEDQQSQLSTYKSEIIELNGELLEMEDIIQDYVIEAWDAWNEELEKTMSYFEYFESLMSGLKNIADLLGLNNDSGFMGEFFETQNSINANRVVATKSNYEEATKRRDEAKEKYENAIGTKDEENFKELYDKAEEEYQDAHVNFYEAVATDLEGIRSQYEYTMEQIVNNIKKSADELREAFDKMKQQNEMWLQDYEKTYEINKLNRSIEQSIDKSANIKNQKELRNLQKELVALQEKGTKVSKYDIGMLQKKYDLLLAEQALKDAQNAKSTVRLTRDSEGNYGYVYTADQEAVTQAQQNYEDKLFALQDYHNQSLEEISEYLISQQEAFGEALEKIYQDTTLSEEERRIKIQETTDFYSKNIEESVEQAQRLTEEGARTNAQFNSNLADSYHDTIFSKIKPDLDSWEQYEFEIKKEIKRSGNELVSAFNEQEKLIGDALERASFDGEDARKKFYEEFALIQESAEDTSSKVIGIGIAFTDGLGEAITSLETFRSDHNTKMSNIRHSMWLTINKVDALIEKYGNLETAASKDYTPKGDDPSDEGEDPEDDLTPTTTQKPGYDANGNIIKWTTYDDAATAGFSNIATSSEFKRNGSMAFKYGNYSNYLLTMQNDLMKTDWDVTEVPTIKAGKLYSLNFKEQKNGSDEMLAYEYKPNNRDNPTNFTKSSERTSKAYSDASNAAKGSFPIGINAYIPTAIINGEKTNLFRVQTGGTQHWINWTDLTQMFGLSMNAEKLRKTVGFDTGGYTGSWGPEGRMAMLHQKEIVLNAQDTENFLSAIKIVRSIADQLETTALASQYGLILSQPSTLNRNQQEALEQYITINAEFPNAIDRNEIEEAFKNLNNLASQYANRKY